jgi:excisionase family DNA binding protein
MSFIAMNKEYLTTFQAAEILSVSPDAVLKWIKSGKIIAYRTPGGHYRIEKKIIDSLINKMDPPSLTENKTPNNFFPYCWEYNGNKNCNEEDCENCLVFKARAMNCFEMSDLPPEFGHLRRFCKSSCLTCEYYNVVNGSN